MHFADPLATLHHRSERASGPREVPDDWQGNATTEVPGQVEVWSYGDEVYGDIDTTERNAGMLRLRTVALPH